MSEIVNADGVMIAQTTDRATADAAARLIAAAPELYEALKLAEWGGYTPSDERQCPVCYGCHDEGHAADCALRAALAKVSPQAGGS